MQDIFHVGYPSEQQKQPSFSPNPNTKTASTILDILGERPEFSKLLELVRKYEDLKDILADTGTLTTLFAPTNEAFDSVSDIDYPTHDVLMYHIADQVYNSSSLRKEPVIKSLFQTKGLENSPQYLRVSQKHPSIPSVDPRRTYWRHRPVWITASSGSDQGVNVDEGVKTVYKGLGGDRSSIYINRAKVTIPDLLAQSGGIVHGVNKIILPPGETILDEIERQGEHFKYLVKAWSETGVDAHIRDGKGITLFAAHDKAWDALPKDLLEWLFSNMGREHLKIVTMYQFGNRPVYTPEIFNTSQGDGYHEVVLPTLLHSAKYELRILAKARRSSPISAPITSQPEYEGPENWLGFRGRRSSKKYACHHHHRRHHKKSRKGRPKHRNPTPHRDEIIVNKEAHVLYGLENWIAGNGVIHVVDKVLMPPRSEGCEKMSAIECSAWEFMWDLAQVGSGTMMDEALVRQEDLVLVDEDK
ncbi:hypothetical protein BCR41DRAFT_387423 [Lobosporangium transversale]|uniref:FAS1 domain-containing protein n=1 Tax=Lobosporangium transversale TaxID=64571 RepID=A0A1Y2GJ74_9FUNG|nr:hypothetical protein BCR41DRAFT_387423 [Lobosporangium transversale]ORZ12492.1 hypothetical protein BCR41DRAFT_387423 [Lobosporangium transversale]|eukprot:XP_021880111.1 hypothetical protein BCR41DRAFT_387423 [Lobosporangium transversale]